MPVICISWLSWKKPGSTAYISKAVPLTESCHSRSHSERLGEWRLSRIIELSLSLRTGIVEYKQWSRPAVYPRAFQTQGTVFIDYLPFVFCSCLPCLKQCTTGLYSQFFAFGFLMSFCKLYFVLLSKTLFWKLTSLQLQNSQYIKAYIFNISGQKNVNLCDVCLLR